MEIQFWPSRYARRADPDTSYAAARHAVSGKAARERQDILGAITINGPMTAREVATDTGMDYIAVQRRISEVYGIERTGDRRDGCMVWGAI